MVELKIKEKEAGQRLDKYLHKYMKEAGTGFLYKMLRKKNITLNGKKAEGNEKLCEGDAVRLFLAEETIEKFGGRLPEGAETIKMASGSDQNGQNNREGQSKQPDLKMESESVKNQRIQQYFKAYKRFGKLEIIFENRHVLIVNKPVGILTQKATPEEVSLNEWLIGYLLNTGELMEEELHTFHPSVCNRLDRNTSGMVICGKTLLGSQRMSELLKDRSLHKYYHLYVKDRIDAASSIESYLVKKECANRVRLAECAEDASYIRTNYKPLKHYKDMTLVEVELITGKTHQIRLHLSSIGHPLLGDYKYGDKRFNDKYKKKYGVKSQLLHAYRLEFPVMRGEFGDLSELALVAQEPEIFDRIDAGESEYYKRK